MNKKILIIKDEICLTRCKSNQETVHLLRLRNFFCAKVVWLRIMMISLISLILVF